MVEKFVIDGATVSDGRAVLKELQGIATKLFDGEEVLKLLKQLFTLVEKDLFMCRDSFKALLEPFHSFFSGL